MRINETERIWWKQQFSESKYDFINFFEEMTTTFVFLLIYKGYEMSEVIAT